MGFRGHCKLLGFEHKVRHPLVCRPITGTVPVIPYGWLSPKICPFLFWHLWALFSLFWIFSVLPAWLNPDHLFIEFYSRVAHETCRKLSKGTPLWSLLCDPIAYSAFFIRVCDHWFTYVILHEAFREKGYYIFHCILGAQDCSGIEYSGFTVHKPLLNLWMVRNSILKQGSGKISLCDLSYSL